MPETAASNTYHHGNLRAELLDTAVEQLRTSSVEDLSLRALAREIGVSQTAPYRHFADKNELLAAMATRGYRELVRALHDAGETASDSPRQELYAFAHAYVTYASNHPQMFKLMFGPSVQPMTPSASERYPLCPRQGLSTWSRGRTVTHHRQP